MMDTDTLALLQESLARYGRERYGFEQRRAHADGPGGYSPQAWRDYADMGWLALPQPPDDGGVASAPEAIGALMEYAGTSLALEPLFASVVLASRALALAGNVDAARAALEQLATGERIATFAHGEDLQPGLDAQATVATREQGGRLGGSKAFVLHGGEADWLVASAQAEGGLGLYLVDLHASGVRVSPYPLVDGRRAARVELDAAPATLLARGAACEAIVASVIDDARLALAAETFGIASAVNALTLAYLKERKQFGRTIGTNQALQHRMVELYLLQEEARALLEAARAAAPAERRAAILAAAAHAHTLGRQATHEAVQMHGGIGVTEELAVSHYFRRVLVVNALLGDRDRLVQAYADAAG